MESKAVGGIFHECGDKSEPGIAAHDPMSHRLPPASAGVTDFAATTAHCPASNSRLTCSSIGAQASNECLLPPWAAECAALALDEVRGDKAVGGRELMVLNHFAPAPATGWP